LDKLKIISQIRRLAIASDSFQQAISLIEHMEQFEVELNDDIFPPMMAGVVTTYARNFNEASGLGPLPKSYEKFSAKELKLAHGNVIKARNKLYAHRDTDNHSYNCNQKISEPYSVQVAISDENDAFLFKPTLIDIPPSRLGDIKKLIAFQLQRLKDDLDSKLAIVVDFDKGYEQGVNYTLGVDFP
jgi:hypothetical protein